MNWIRICVNIADDPAVGAIADACDIPLAEALGGVVAVLCKLPAHAEDGALAGIPDRTLEKWANWEHERGAFARAFREAMCDEGGVVKAWDRHNGSAIREAKAARERMRESRKKPRPEPDPNTPKETPARSRERAPNVRRTFASNGTGRNEHPPTSPDGSVVPPVPPMANPMPSGPLFAEWEKTLFAAALPHEAAALEHVCSLATFRPAVIGELYAIASGQHVVRGEHAPYREANAADVMRAVSEYACKNREWNTSYFRGVVRRILNRPPEPPDAAQRDIDRQAKQLVAAVPSLSVEKPRTAEEIEAGRARREAAMAKFREEAMRNSQGERRAAEPASIGSIVPAAVNTLVA